VTALTRTPKPANSPAQVRILTQVRRDPAPLEASLDAMIDHVAELLA
jgi:hypothetical protein